MRVRRRDGERARRRDGERARGQQRESARTGTRIRTREMRSREGVEESESKVAVVGEHADQGDGGVRVRVRMNQVGGNLEGVHDIVHLGESARVWG